MSGFSMGGRSFGGNMSGGGWPTGGLWDAMEQLRGEFDRRVGTRMGRGDVRAAILAILAEQPMHGYQIIQEIEERSHGAWKPSPGSVYPTLQLLADEGLVLAEEAGGRKTYSLTEEGRAVADAAGDAPWHGEQSREFTRATALPKAGANLAQATMQVATTGTPEQVEEAIAVLEDARRKLFAILAQD